MKVTILGGTGFFGRHIVNALLQRDCEVVPVGRRHVELLNERETALYLMAEKPDVLVHAAATCGGIGANRDEPARFMEENLRMGINVLEGARRAGIGKVILIGTACSYPRDATPPVGEDALWTGYPERTNAPYGIAKAAIVELGHQYFLSYGLPVISLIPTNLYGPHDNFDLKTSHVIPAMVRKFTEAKGEVTLWGTGKPTRDFLYVADAAEAVWSAITYSKSHGRFNLSTGRQVAMADLARIIAGMCKFEGEIKWDKTYPDGQPARSLDPSRANGALGWLAETTLLSGLRETVDWYQRTRADAPKR